MIGNVELMDEEGDETYCGDKVVGVRVYSSNQVGMVELDVRDFKEGKKAVNLLIRIELSELVAAISHATFNADKE